MRLLSRKVLQGEESQTLALADKARQMRAKGIDVISLTAGEPDFPTPQHIKEAAIKAIEANFTKYTSNQGIPDLIEAIIRKFSLENDLHFEPDQILVSTGAKQSIYNALQAITNKGDEVVIVSPYWVSYPEMVKLVDGVPVIVPAGIKEKFIPDVRAIRRVINGKTKAIILNSPNNPSGAVFTKSLIEELAAIVKETGVYVISDEIYEKVIYDGRKHYCLGAMKSIRDQVITVNGVSKAFSMTGWRIGYMGGPRDVILAAAKFQSQVTSNANSIAQRACVAALTGSLRDLDSMVEEFQRRRDTACSALSHIPRVDVVAPGGAFYIFFGIEAFLNNNHGDRRIRCSDELSTYLIEKHHVGTVPGSAFGDDSCIRISYACSTADLEKGLQRIKTGLTELNS